MTAPVLPPALFELEAMAPPIFDPAVKAATLTLCGRHHGLGPGVWDVYPVLCGQARYAAAVDAGRRVWFWHACSTVGPHETHQCDRCEQTWEDH